MELSKDFDSKKIEKQIQDFQSDLDLRKLKLRNPEAV